MLNLFSAGDIISILNASSIRSKFSEQFNYSIFVVLSFCFALMMLSIFRISGGRRAVLLTFGLPFAILVDVVVGTLAAPLNINWKTWNHGMN